MTTIVLAPDLSALFLDTRPPRIYETEYDEFDAVCDGRKAMAMFDYALRWPAAVEEMHEVIEDAKGAGLVVESFNADGIPPQYAAMTVLVARVDEAWRIPALKELLKVLGYYRWTHGLEAMMSGLLGYSAPEVKAWIAMLRDERAGWQGETVYFKLTVEQAQLVAAHGSRYLSSGVIDLGAILCFVGRGPYSIVKAAHGAVPDGVSIARVLLSRDYAHPSLRTLREAPGTGPVGFTVDRTNVHQLNGSMRTALEFLTAAGWVVKERQPSPSTMADP